MSGVVGLSSVRRWPSEGPDKEGLCFADAIDVASALARGFRDERLVRAVVKRREWRARWCRAWGRKLNIGDRAMDFRDMMLAIPVLCECSAEDFA